MGDMKGKSVHVTHGSDLVTKSEIVVQFLFLPSNFPQYSPFGFLINNIPYAIQYGGIFTQGCTESESSENLRRGLNSWVKIVHSYKKTLLLIP
jgi:hypothetical protein